jgi:hypothetical protein
MSEQLAKLFHETYERLAPTFGYETRKGSAVPWDQVPARNKRLMIAVADLIELEYFSAKQAGEDADAMSLGDEFFATNGYGARTKKPFVTLAYNGRQIAQMRPEDATNLAHNLLACAEASLGDAFLIEFMRERVGLEDPQIGGLLGEFREWRDGREEEEQKP